MAVTYKKLFHLLIDKGMTNAELMEKAGFSANIITRIDFSNFSKNKAEYSLFKQKIRGILKRKNNKNGGSSV